MRTPAVTSGSDPFHRALRGYLATVARALGVGLESCALDVDTPVSAYLAVDHKIASCPDRDVALVWDEQRGWSIAVETYSGEDLILLADLESDTAVPPAAVVARFVEDFCAGKSGGTLASIASVA